MHDIYPRLDPAYIQEMFMFNTSLPDLMHCAATCAVRFIRKVGDVIPPNDEVEDEIYSQLNQDYLDSDINPNNYSAYQSIVYLTLDMTLGLISRLSTVISHYPSLTLYDIKYMSNYDITDIAHTREQVW